MSDDRKNLKIHPEAYQRLTEAKQPTETWDVFLCRLLETDEEGSVTLAEEDKQDSIRGTASELEDRLQNY